MEPQGNIENILKFKGFRSPRYTQVPDEIFDELMHVLSGAEIKVLLYICRRTFGFKKDSDAISLSQISNGITTKDGRVLDRGTGLSKAAVATATKRLEDLGVIVRGRMRSKERGDEPTTYSLNIVPVIPVSKNWTPPVDKIGHPRVQKLDTQYTVIQYTDNNVNVDKEGKGKGGTEEPKTDLHRLPDLDQPPEQADYIAGEILAVLGDDGSKAFYRLVAAKIPESFIRQKLSELRQGSARSPAKVFASIVRTHAAEKLSEQKMKSISLAKQGLFRYEMPP